MKVISEVSHHQPHGENMATGDRQQRQIELRDRYLTVMTWMAMLLAASTSALVVFVVFVFMK